MVGIRVEDRITIVTIHRPEARNAVDRDTAEALSYAFREFDADPNSDVAILMGAGGNFCAGADLKAFNNHLSPEGDGPMGPTRLRLSKPVIAAVERLGTRVVVRFARGRENRHFWGVLQAFWSASDRPGNRSAAATDRAKPGARHDSDRSSSVGRGSAAHGIGQPFN